ncbi:MAG: hypothetical protein QXY55_03140 [Candidatus Korarchaeota archaeon]
MTSKYHFAMAVLMALIILISSTILQVDVVTRDAKAINILRNKQGYNPLIAIYTEGKPELSITDYSDLLAIIDGLGLRYKNISKLSFIELANTTSLLLLGQREFSDADIDTLTKYVMLSGGSILYLVPTNLTESSKKFLKLFGIQPLGIAYDNVSHYENDSRIIILNKTWHTESHLMRDLESIIVANASALNLTSSLDILTNFNLTNTLNISDNRSVPLVYSSPLIWGGNNTTVEYKKGYYLYGPNVTLGVSIKLWSGSRVLVISSPHTFANRYIRLPQFDNEKLLKNTIRWLIKDLESIRITTESRSPEDGLVYLASGVGHINATFRVTIGGLDYQSNLEGSNKTLISELGLNLLAGIEYLGILTRLFDPKIVNETYNTTTKEAQLVVEAATNVSYERSVVVYLRLVVFNDQYGFFWSERIRFEILIPRVLLGKFHPVVLIAAIAIAFNVVLAILLYPHAKKYKQSVKEFEKKIQ